jgi:ubiquinone/menaquinone biosynthesis C-methylase UbiE
MEDKLICTYESNNPMSRRLYMARSRMVEALLGEAVKNLEPGYRFLDVGCGSGWYVKKMETKNKYGLDISKKILLDAKKYDKNAKFVYGNAEKLPFKEETFDLVLSSEVIEHLDNYNEGISEVYRVLKKGGYAVFTTPNFFSFLESCFFFISLLNGRTYEHKHFLPSYFFRKLEKEGFKILRKETSCYLSYPFRHCPIDQNKMARFFDKFDNAMKRVPFLKWAGWSTGCLCVKN